MGILNWKDPSQMGLPKFQIGNFRSKSIVPIDSGDVVFLVVIGAKGSVKIFTLTRVLFITAILTIALRCEVKIQQTPSKSKRELTRPIVKFFSSVKLD